MLSVFVWTMVLPSHQAHKARSVSAAVYVRHRPETTLLYQIVQEYWPEFQAELTSHGKYLPAYITKEFDEYLKCGRLEYGFLRVKCEACHDKKWVAFSCMFNCMPRGLCPSCSARRMVESVHRHMLFLDRNYTFRERSRSQPEDRFWPLSAVPYLNAGPSAFRWKADVYHA